MPISTLDPISALVVIDLQQGIVALPTSHPASAVVANAARLAGAFREHHLPVVLVNVAGVAPGRTERNIPMGKLPADWAYLVPELGRRPEDHLVTKQRWGAFHDTDLHAYLVGRGATQILLAGIATSIGVESTARSAHEHGYNVSFALDAMTDTSIEAHDNSASRIFPRLGETGATDDVVANLRTRP